MGRITICTLRAVVAETNATLEANRNPHRLKVTPRNGHCAVDLYDSKKCVRNVETGTARECIAAVYGLEV